MCVCVCHIGVSVVCAFTLGQRGNPPPPPPPPTIISVLQNSNWSWTDWGLHQHHFTSIHIDMQWWASGEMKTWQRERNCVHMWTLCFHRTRHRLKQMSAQQFLLSLFSDFNNCSNIEKLPRGVFSISVWRTETVATATTGRCYKTSSSSSSSSQNTRKRIRGPHLEVCTIGKC